MDARDRPASLFVQIDRYGRAWVPFYEGMSQQPHVTGIDVRAYRPSDVATLCPGWLGRVCARVCNASASLSRICASFTHVSAAFAQWIVTLPGHFGGGHVRLEPGWARLKAPAAFDNCTGHRASQ